MKIEGVLLVLGVVAICIGLPVIWECQHDKDRAQHDKDRAQRDRRHCHAVTASAILNCEDSECERRANAALDVCLKGIAEEKEFER